MSTTRCFAVQQCQAQSPGQSPQGGHPALCLRRQPIRATAGRNASRSDSRVVVLQGHPWHPNLQTSDGTYDAGEVECKAAEELCNKISCSGEPGGLARALQPNRSWWHCCHPLRLAFPFCIAATAHPTADGTILIFAGLIKFSCDPADSTNSKCTCVSAGLASCFPGGLGTNIMRQQVGENTRGVGTHESRNL